MYRIHKAYMFVCIMILIAHLSFFTSVDELGAQSGIPDIDWPSLEVISMDNLNRLTNLAHANLEGSEVTSLASFYSGDSLLIGAILGHQHVYLLEVDPAAVSIKALNSYPDPNVRELAFSEQGNLLGVAASSQVDVWNLIEEQSSTLPLPTSIFYSLDFRPHSETLAIGAVDRIIEWDLATNSTVQTLVIPGAIVEDIGFSPDGNLLAVGMGGGVTLVDWENNQEVPLGITSIPNGEVLFSPNGTMLAHMSEVGDDIALWNINEDGLIQIKEQGKSEPGSDIDFSADGQLLWVVTSDGVEIYNGLTGDYIDIFDPFSDPVTTVSLSSDGKLLVTGHANGDVNIWGVLPEIPASTSTPVPTATPSLPAFNPLSACWVKHWNGQGSTEWRITNPNPVPLSTNPEVKVRYNWTVYSGPDGTGTVRQSASGWDNGNPNPVNTAYAQSMRLEWYLVIDGQPTDILGETVVNADASGQCPAPPVGSGTGLQGEYFNKKDFTRLALTRVDPAVDFDWGKAAPAPEVQKNSFSVRWTGWVEPLYSEPYTFYTVSDDGVRLWVNDQPVIDHWNNHSAHEDSGSIALEAGQRYRIRLEYYENGGDAVAHLLWSSVSQTKGVVSQSQLYPPTP